MEGIKWLLFTLVGRIKCTTIAPATVTPYYCFHEILRFYVHLSSTIGKTTGAGKVTTRYMWCSWHFNLHIVTLNKDSSRVLSYKNMELRSLSSFNSIKTLIYHNYSPSKLKTLVQLCFIEKKWSS